MPPKKKKASPVASAVVSDVAVYIHEPGIGGPRLKILRENAVKLGFAVHAKLEPGRTTHVVTKRSLKGIADDLRLSEIPKAHFVDPKWLIACANEKKRMPEEGYVVLATPTAGPDTSSSSGSGSSVRPASVALTPRAHSSASASPAASPRSAPPRASSSSSSSGALKPAPSAEHGAAADGDETSPRERLRPHESAEDFLSCSLAMDAGDLPEAAAAEPSQAMSQATTCRTLLGAPPPPPPPPPPTCPAWAAANGGEQLTASQFLWADSQSAFASPGAAADGATRKRRKFRFRSGEWVGATPSPAKPAAHAPSSPDDDGGLAYGFLAAAAPLLLPPAATGPSSPGREGPSSSVGGSPPRRARRLRLCEDEGEGATQTELEDDHQAAGGSGGGGTGTSTRTAGLLARYLGFANAPAQLVHQAALAAAAEEEEWGGIDAGTGAGGGAGESVPATQREREGDPEEAMDLGGPSGPAAGKRRHSGDDAPRRPRSLQELAAAVWAVAAQAREASAAHIARIRQRELAAAWQAPNCSDPKFALSSGAWYSCPAPPCRTVFPAELDQEGSSPTLTLEEFLSRGEADRTDPRSWMQRWPGETRRWYPRMDEGGATSKPLPSGVDPSLVLSPWDFSKDRRPRVPREGEPPQRPDRPRPQPIEANVKIAKVLEELKELSDARGFHNDGFRAYSLGRAAIVIKNLPFEVLEGADLKGMRNIGKGVIEKVDQIIATGTLQRIRNMAHTDPLKTYVLFQTIWGIGPKTARDLYARGYRTLEDLVQHRDELNSAQQIGLRLRDDFLKRIPRAEVARIEHEVKLAARKIDPGFLVVCCGSFRRGKADCGDCDVLVSHPSGTLHMGALGPILETLSASGFLTDTLTLSTDNEGLPPGADAPRLTTQRFFGVCRLPDEKDPSKMLPHRRLDVIVVPYEHWACSLLYFTGSGLFNRRMRLKARPSPSPRHASGFRGVKRVPPARAGAHPRDVPERENHPTGRPRPPGAYPLPFHPPVPIQYPSLYPQMAIISEERPFPVFREEDVFEVLEMKYEPPQNRNLG
eukprot:tig00000189_g14337.t1